MHLRISGEPDPICGNWGPRSTPTLAAPEDIRPVCNWCQKADERGSTITTPRPL